MGGVTLSGFPYVTPDDHPIDFPAHSLALANLLEIDHNSYSEDGLVWPESGWVDLGNQYAGLLATRHSGMVTLEGAVKRTAALTAVSGTFYTCAYVPAGFRPSHDVNSAGYGILGAEGYDAQRIRVTRAGALEVFAIANGNWAIDQWVAFDLTYRWDTNV